MKYLLTLCLFLFVLSCKTSHESEVKQKLTGVWHVKTTEIGWVSSVIEIPNRIPPLTTPTEMISVPRYVTDSFQLVFNNDFEYEYISPAFKLKHQGSYQIKNDRISLIWLNRNWLELDIENKQQDTMSLTIDQARMLIPGKDSSKILIARGIKLMCIAKSRTETTNTN